jgi:hypothetical protein
MVLELIFKGKIIIVFPNTKAMPEINYASPAEALAKEGVMNLE